MNICPDKLKGAPGVTAGNFRELMEVVTLNPAMGVYLSMLGNEKPDSAGLFAPEMEIVTECAASNMTRIIPAVSVDQFAATLARWFGVAHTQRDAIARNLRNFAQRDLGCLT